MVQPMYKSYRPALFSPNTSFTGAEPPVLIWGEGMWVRSGKNGTVYAEGYTGNLDLNEPIDTREMTGTIAWDSTTKTVTGTGTDFYTEQLHPGQFVFGHGGAGAGVLLVVEEVVDATHFLATSKPPTTASGKKGHICPVVYPVGVKRGTSVSGSVIQFLQGHYIGVGQGTFKINGQPLNATFTLSKTPQMALYNPVTGLFTINDVGISLPGAEPRISVAAFTPGTATMMRASSHSVRVQANNTSTKGYSQPSEPIAPVVIAAGDQIAVTFLNAMNSDQDSYKIYSSESNDAAVAEIEHRYQGPWYYVKTVTAAELIDGGHPTGREAGTVHKFDFQDGEIVSFANLISFNNFTAKDALFVDSVNGIPIYFSCQGKGNTVFTGGTCPGPSAIPSKPDNPEAVFLDKTLSMALNDYIMGEVQFKSRIYALGQMSLQVIILTTVEDEPIAFRSLWNVGFRNPYAVDGFKEYLYGFSTAGIVRAVAGGDDSDFEFNFDSDVKTHTRDWDPGKVLVRYDPKNRAMIFFRSAFEQRSNHWVTEALPFMIDTGVFNMPIILSKSDRDFIVSGAATVGNELVFLAGGRRDSDGTVEFRTYVFDGGDSTSKSWNMCWAYTDDGLNVNTKRLESVTATARLQNGATVKAYIVPENGEFKIADLKAGTNDNGQYALPSTTGFIQRLEPVAGETEAASLYTFRIEGANTGSTVDTVDRVDELVLKVAPHGAEG